MSKHSLELLWIIKDLANDLFFQLRQDVIDIFTWCFSFFTNLLKLQNIQNIPSMQLVLKKLFSGHLEHSILHNI